MLLYAFVLGLATHFVCTFVYGISGIIVASRPEYPRGVKCLCWTPNGKDGCCDIRVSNFVLAVVNATFTSLLGVLLVRVDSLGVAAACVAPFFIGCAVNVCAFVALQRGLRPSGSARRSSDPEPSVPNISVYEAEAPIALTVGLPVCIVEVSGTEMVGIPEEREGQPSVPVSDSVGASLNELSTMVVMGHPVPA